MNESYVIYTSGAKKQASQIVIYFQDKIKDSDKVFKLSLFEWIRIDELKKKIAKQNFKNHLSWTDLRLFYKNIELLPDHRRLFDFGVEPENSIIIKSIELTQNIEKGLVNPYQIFSNTPDQIKNLWLEVQSGLNNGKKPKLAEEGTSGTYFLENHLKKVVAIFKPYDQEPFSENNPKGYSGVTGSIGIRRGILSGQSATRQVASYLLDDHKFHGVPETTFVQFFHPSFIKKCQTCNPIVSNVQIHLNSQHQLKTKHGSLQRFMESNDIVGNMGSNQFDIDEVHKIGILDLRILNCDRNQANILVRKVIVGKQKKKFLQMIPIDHGLTFPDNLEIYDYELVWMGYRQSSQPFSKKSLQYIENIDPVQDCKKLREKLGFREICLRNFRIAETFLKKAAKQGFTLQQIGEMIYRKDDDDENYEESKQNISHKNLANLSDLERIVNQAENIYCLIKQNGMKSTVNFQLNFTRDHSNKDSLPNFINKPLQGKKLSENSTSLEKKNENLTKIQRKTEQQIIKSRNVSLPNLKIRKKNQKADKQKRMAKKNKEPEQQKALKQKRQEKWQQIFFHYFQEFLERFISEKKKKLFIQTPSRSRILSQDI